MTLEESSFEKVRRKMVAARIAFMGQLATFQQSELTSSPIEGGWSPLLIVYHLYIADGFVLEQMHRVQEEENPLTPDGAKVIPHLTETAEPPVSLEAVLAGMAARREEIFEYLASLPEDAWTRPYRHETWGDRQFYQLVNALPQHDQMHTQQLQEIKAAREKAQQDASAIEHAH